MDLTMQINEVIEQRRSSIDNCQMKVTNSSIDNSQMTIDRVLDSFPLLVSEEFRAWHATQIKRLGAKKYIELADRATKYGKEPAKLFSSLLKKY